MRITKAVLIRALKEQRRLYVNAMEKQVLAGHTNDASFYSGAAAAVEDTLATVAEFAPKKRKAT